MRRIAFAFVALVSTGCAGILGLDEFTEGETGGPGAGGGTPTTSTGGDPTTSSTGTSGDGGGPGSGGAGGGAGTALDVTPDGPVKVGVFRALQFTSNVPASWSVDEDAGGEIDETGFYVSPDVPGTFHVTASSIENPEDTVTTTVNAAPLALRVVAGQPGGPGTIDGPPNRSRVDRVAGIAVLDDGQKVLFADEQAHTIRILEDQVVTTIAGRPYQNGAVDGVGDAARFDRPGPVAAARDSSIAYVFDRGNHCLRRINTTNGTVTTLAGECGARGHVDGATGADVRFEEVSSIVMGPTGDRLFACEVGGGTRSIRVINPTTGATTSILEDQIGAYLSWDCRLAAHYYSWVYVYPGDSAAPIKRFEDRPQFDATTLSDLAPPPSGTWFSALTADTGYGDDALYAVSRQTVYKLDLDNPQEGFFPFFGNDDEYVYVDGTLDEARLLGSQAMAVRPGYDEIYFGDQASSLRVIDTRDEEVRTVAGKPANTTPIDGPEDQARLLRPFGLELDEDGNTYIAEFTSEGGNVIRKIDGETGEVGPFSGVRLGENFEIRDGAADFATFGFVLDMVRVGDALFLADIAAHTVRRISLVDGSVTTIAGQTLVQGFDDGFGDAATFNFNQGAGLATDGTDLFVADSLNHAIRKIDLATSEVTTIAGGTEGVSNGTGLEAEFLMPVGLAHRDGILYISDYADQVVRQMDLASGEVTTLIGLSGTAGQIDGGPSEATLSEPFRMEVDDLGNLFVTALGDFEGGTGGLLIRRIDLDEVTISAFAGSRTEKGFAIGQLPGTVGCPSAMRIDANGDLVFADFCDGVVAVIRPI